MRSDQLKKLNEAVRSVVREFTTDKDGKADMNPQPRSKYPLSRAFVRGNMMSDHEGSRDYRDHHDEIHSDESEGVLYHHDHDRNNPVGKQVLSDDEMNNMEKSLSSHPEYNTPEKSFHKGISHGEKYFEHMENNGYDEEKSWNAASKEHDLPHHASKGVKKALDHYEG